jgi:hypothetical protein
VQVVLDDILLVNAKCMYNYKHDILLGTIVISNRHPRTAGEAA